MSLIEIDQKDYTKAHDCTHAQGANAWRTQNELWCAMNRLIVFLKHGQQPRRHSHIFFAFVKNRLIFNMERHALVTCSAERNPITLSTQLLTPSAPLTSTLKIWQWFISFFRKVTLRMACATPLSFPIPFQSHDRAWVSELSSISYFTLPAVCYCFGQSWHFLFFVCAVKFAAVTRIIGPVHCRILLTAREPDTRLSESDADLATSIVC